MLTMSTPWFFSDPNHHSFVEALFLLSKCTTIIMQHVCISQIVDGAAIEPTSIAPSSAGMWLHALLVFRSQLLKTLP